MKVLYHVTIKRGGKKAVELFSYVVVKLRADNCLMEFYNIERFPFAYTK